MSCFTVYCTQDVVVSTIDFEGALPGMTYLFSAPKKHHLIMPEVAILSEEEAAGTSVDHQNNPHHTESIDIENTSILAKRMGMSEKQLMASQKAVLEEAEKSKKEKAAQELKLLEQALPDQSGGSPFSQRKYLGSKTKSASVAHGEEIYNHLSSRGYQQKQPYERSVHLEPSPEGLPDQQPRKQIHEQAMAMLKEAEKSEQVKEAHRKYCTVL